MRKSMPKTLSPLAVALMTDLQEGFPLCASPFEVLATRLNTTSSEIIATLKALLADGVLTRFGPLFQIERSGGAFVLAAMAVPEDRFKAVTEQVNAFPQVAHNYRREHALNMWFVLATETPAGIAEVQARIEAVTNLKVSLFPKEREYFVDMRLPPHPAMRGGQ